MNALEVMVLDRQRARAVGAQGLSAFLHHAARLCPGRVEGTLNVRLVSDRAMRAFNREFRGKDSATDVLSFPADGASASFDEPHLGDVVISVTTAIRQAKERGHSVSREVKTLALHGMLHALGYDHHGDGGKMMRLQRRLERRLFPPRSRP